MHRTLLAIAIVAACSVEAGGDPIRCTGHAHGVFAVAISPDGTLAASCDKATVRIWNTSDGSAVRELNPIQSEAPDHFITDASFSPDGKVLAIAAANDVITFWDTESWERLEKSLPVESPASHLAYSPDGSKLAVAENAAVKVWDLATTKLVHEFLFNGAEIGRAWRVAYSPDGLLLGAALHDYGASFIPKEPKVRVWSTGSGSIVFTARNRWSASGVAFSPDSRLLAYVGQKIEIADVTTHLPVRQIEPGERAVFCIAFSPDGKTIAMGGNDSAIKLWSVESGKLSGTLKGHSGQVHDLCFSNDGKTIVSGGTEGTVLIWNVATDIDKE